VLILVVVIVVILIIVHVVRTKTGPAGRATPHQAAAGVQPAPAGVFPPTATQQQPLEITFDGCPPDGDGGDAALNHLKNRVDQSITTYTRVPFDSVERLPWPPSVDRRSRATWGRADRAAVARYEGLPIAIEGFLAGSRQEGPESTNCHGAGARYRDWHLWLVGRRGDDRIRSVVVEATPRVRATHPAWRLAELMQVARAHQRIRVSGWLMLDQEHPEQLGKTRGTLWEIHPIMRIAIQRRGTWVAFDSLPPSTRTRRHAKSDSAQGDAMDRRGG
jgi:hypothetical protein